MEVSSLRLVGVVVFGLSVALLVALQSTQLGRFRARAVATAASVEHPALIASFVSAVRVQPGDRVEVGTPLVELSGHFLERELARLEAEIARRSQESELAGAQLAVDEEQWLEPSLRRRPNRPSLRRETDTFFRARLAELETARSQLLEDRLHTTVTSRSAGRVAFVVSLGSPVEVGGSVASVVPEYAEEIVAFVPPETDPQRIAPGLPVRVLDSQVAECRGTGVVQRRGASVIEAPGQLAGFLGRPLHGMPVYISAPGSCPLGVGQVLSVEFPKAGA
jgi:multidrug resistance efflux pump